MTAADATLEALGERGLDLDLLTQHDMIVGASGELAIAFKREGRIVRRKYRTFGKDKKFWQDKDGVRCAWNEDALREVSFYEMPLIITEGELDGLSLIQAGFSRTISVPDGAPPPGERSAEELSESRKYAWLEEVRPLLSQSKVATIILAVDGDENGAALMHDLSVLLGRARCKFVTYPKARHPDARGRERLKDMNEVLEEYGVAGVRAVIERASWLKVDGVYRMSELPPLPSPRVFDMDRCGLSITHKHFRPRLGDLSVVTGVPGMGKSTWVNDVWCRVAQTYEITVGWASFEQAPQRDHKRALRAWYLEMSAHRQMPDDICEADDWIDARHRLIVPGEDDDVTLDWFLDRAEAAVVQHGCSAIICDPWNEMDHDRRPGENQTEYTGRAIKKLKRFAKAFQVHMCVVAHPSKMRRNPDGKYPTPSLYDISDSAHWYNKPDLGIVIHRDKERTTMTTMKSRYHDIIGRPGAVSLDFCGESRRFSEVEAAPDAD